MMAASDTPRTQDARFTGTEQDYISTIERRIEWLAQRQVGGQSPSMTDWIKRELAALNWVLRILVGGDHDRYLGIILAIERDRREHEGRR